MAGAKPRALVFPDHTADDFDPDVVVTHNDIDYTWNGYGWEVVCKGGGSVEEYDDQWIKDDQVRQDEEFKKDQERQDKEIEDLKESLNACTGRAEELTCVGLHVSGDADTWPLEGQWSYNDSPYINQIFVETNWIEDIGTHPNVVDKIWINEVKYEVQGANYTTSNALGRDCLSINTVARIPDEITSGNEKIHLSLCPPGYDFVTRPEFEEDQQRQDDAIEELQDKTSLSCHAPPLTDVLTSGLNDPLHWSMSGTGSDPHWKITVREELHQGSWPRPNNITTKSIWVNNEEYPCLDVGNQSGSHWTYELGQGKLDHLVGQEVTVSLCQAGVPWVTHQELEEDQERQDEEWAKDQKRQDDALEAEINARANRDLLHDAQLNTLEFKLDQLVGLTFKGTYEFKHEADCDAAYDQCVADCWDNDPDDHECRTDCGRTHAECEADKVRAGFFEAVDPDDQFDHLEQIIISKSDIDGVELDWSGVLDAGDYLEVDHSLKGELDKRNYGLYRITEEPEHTQNNIGEDVYIIKLQFLQGDGVLAEGEVYEIRGITAAEGVNPEELGDFLTKDEASNTYALKTHNHDSRYHAKNTTNGGNYFVTANHQEILKSNYHSKGSNQNILLNDHTTIAQSTFATAHNHPYASNTHNHNGTYVKGNFEITKDSYGNYYIS